MNKVLVTGLGTANAFGVCEACNLDFSWIVNNLSTLLWADKICIPKDSFEHVLKKTVSKDEKAIKVVLSMADERKIIEKINVSDMYQEHVGDFIYKQVLRDSEKLLQEKTEIVSKGDGGVPDEIIIEGSGYCGAWMASVYAGIKLATDINANCLFGEREHKFLKYLYSVGTNLPNQGMINKAYNDIFSLYLPESMKIHSYAFTPEEQCEECLHYNDCKEKYILETENCVNQIMEWREYDELQNAKQVIDRIVRIKNDVSSEKDIEVLKHEFKEIQVRINRNIHGRFPKIQRWTKMTTSIATPFTVVGAIEANSKLTIGSAAAISLAQTVDGFMEAYKNKNNWVSFVNNLRET